MVCIERCYTIQAGFSPLMTVFQLKPAMDVRDLTGAGRGMSCECNKKCSHFNLANFCFVKSSENHLMQTFLRYL